MSNKTYMATRAPSEVKLLIHSKQLTDLGVVDEGYIIIPLTQFDTYTHQYSRILRVGYSRTKLKKWLRAYKHNPKEVVA
jgi:hypothetical protein